MLLRELKGLIVDGEPPAIIHSSQNLVTRWTTMSESDGNNTEAEVLFEELRQKFMMAQEELEKVRCEAAELTKQEGEQQRDRARELMNALDKQMMRMQEMEQEKKEAAV